MDMVSFPIFNNIYKQQKPMDSVIYLILSNKHHSKFTIYNKKLKIQHIKLQLLLCRFYADFV